MLGFTKGECSYQKIQANRDIEDGLMEAYGDQDKLNQPRFESQKERSPFKKEPTDSEEGYEAVKERTLQSRVTQKTSMNKWHGMITRSSSKQAPKEKLEQEKKNATEHRGKVPWILKVKIAKVVEEGVSKGYLGGRTKLCELEVSNIS
ncbi:hypothetical protein QYF36_009370 [Acer negundo]|nr:hypothetical protein QYF36_009370 [Acer negundo]